MDAFADLRAALAQCVRAAGGSARPSQVAADAAVVAAWKSLPDLLRAPLPTLLPSLDEFELSWDAERGKLFVVERPTPEATPEGNGGHDPAAAPDVETRDARYEYVAVVYDFDGAGNAETIPVALGETVEVYIFLTPS